ncbi:MAG TPA: isochorismatase family protein [Longimicrobiales bacterium]
MAYTAGVPIERSALLVIDVQDSFRVGSRWERRGNRDFESNLDRLVRSYRAAGLPVIFFLHTDADEGFRPEDPELRLMDFLRPEEGEPVLVKTTRNAFASTNLREILEGKGVRRLVVTGIQTEQCCETTARVAADVYGYAVDFVTEATQSFPIPHPNGVEELGPEEVMRRTEYVLRGRFARIATVDELVAELESVTV